MMIEKAVDMKGCTDKGSVHGAAEKSGRQLALHESKSKVKSKRKKWNHERVTLVRLSPR